MPYIGNSHIAGDHTNNFKVLDDISSFTATFDGPATSVVDTTNDTIRVVEHRFIQGQRVTYTNGSGGNIGGITTGTAYFVIFDSANTIKLATNASNAASSTAINLSAVGTGSSHTLNVAFDGVNTKFKLTHSTGTDARLNNASQINIAINNVLQRPNLDPNNFTDGFALEDNHKIVFQTAPTSEDIFWGSIIANTLTTFDISDHKIDTFTGDGSTTEFTLSHTPANNESLMVTINGVLQHPSNASTARAYTLIASIIQFTAAPGVGDEIQVRHLGFAGATTADVSGFYGRTGNVALNANDHITTGDITARNINASGILTASSASFGGNVSIGGTLTYEDVSNIDSVGIITARDGIHVGAGISAVGVGTFGGIKVGTGVTIETNGNSNFVGVSSLGTGATGAVYLYNPDADALSGTTNDIYGWKAKTYTSGLQVNSTLYLSRSGVHGLSLNYNNATGGTINQSVGFLNIICPGGLPIYLNAYQHVLQDPGGKKRIVINNSSDQAVHLYHNNVLKFSTADSGINVVGTTTSTQLAVTGISTFTGNIDANGDLDVDGHTNLDNVSVAGVVTATSFSGPATQVTVSDESSDTNTFLVFTNGATGNQTAHTGTNLTFNSSTGNLSATKFTGDGSGLTGITQTTINSNTNNYLITGTGTANTLQGEANMTFDGSLLTIAKRVVIGNGSEFQIPSRSNTSTYTPQLQITGAWNNPTHGGTLALNGRNDYPILWLNSGANMANGAGAGTMTFSIKDSAGNYCNTATIRSQVDGTLAIMIHPGRLQFMTTPDNTCNPVERLRITSDGRVGIGLFSNLIYQLEIKDNSTNLIRINNSGESGHGSHDAYIIAGGTYYQNPVIGGPVIKFNTFNGSTFDTRVRIDASGRLLVNNSSSTSPDGFNSLIQVNSANHEGSITIGRHTANANGPGLIFQKSRSGTATPGNGVLSNGDVLGTIRYYGSDGTDRNSFAASISCEVDGTRKPNDMPGRLIFLTTADGSASSTERLRIRSDGHVVPGADATQDFGTSSNRWRNVYTTDLQLSNENTGGNEVDGTEGNWTLQEGESDIYMINRKTGKKYKMMLQEIN